MPETGTPRTAFKLAEWLRQLHPALFVLVIAGLTFTATVVGNIFLSSLISTPSTEGPLKSASVGTRIVMGSLVGPLFETALFQALPFWLLVQKLRLPSYVAVFASAALFGLAHNYSIEYVVLGFITGLILAFAYASLRPSTGRAFILVALSHALHNTISTAIMYWA